MQCRRQFLLAATLSSLLPASYLFLQFLVIFSSKSHLGSLARGGGGTVLPGLKPAHLLSSR